MAVFIDKGVFVVLRNADDEFSNRFVGVWLNMTVFSFVARLLIKELGKFVIALAGLSGVLCMCVRIAYPRGLVYDPNMSVDLYDVMGWFSAC